MEIVVAPAMSVKKGRVGILQTDQLLRHLPMHNIMCLPDRLNPAEMAVVAVEVAAVLVHDLGPVVVLVNLEVMEVPEVMEALEVPEEAADMAVEAQLVFGDIIQKPV